MSGREERPEPFVGSVCYCTIGRWCVVLLSVAKSMKNKPLARGRVNYSQEEKAFPKPAQVSSGEETNSLCWWL